MGNNQGQSIKTPQELYNLELVDRNVLSQTNMSKIYKIQSKEDKQFMALKIFNVIPLGNGLRKEDPKEIYSE